jgi:hypothetical protein
MTAPKDPAVRAIRAIRTVRDELEQIGRVPGERLEITRQQLDAMFDNLGIAARSIREREEQSSTEFPTDRE